MKPIVLLILLLCFQNSYCQIPSDSLLLDLKIDKTLIDQSTKKLIIHNHNTTYVTDRYSNKQSAIALNGKDQYLEIQDTLLFRPKNMSVSAWICIDSIRNEKTSILHKTLGTATNSSLFVELENKMIIAGIGDASGKGPLSTFTFIPRLNQWIHIAFVFDDDRDFQKLYVNGMLVDSTHNTKSMEWDKHPLLIGAGIENETLGAYFKGKIDGIRIYSKAIGSLNSAALTYEPDSLRINIYGTVNYLNKEGKQINLIDISCINNYCDDGIIILFPDINLEESEELFFEITKKSDKTSKTYSIKSNELTLDFDNWFSDSYEEYLIRIINKDKRLYMGCEFKLFTYPGV